MPKRKINSSNSKTPTSTSSTPVSKKRTKVSTDNGLANKPDENVENENNAIVNNSEVRLTRNAAKRQTTVINATSVKNKPKEEKSTKVPNKKNSNLKNDAISGPLTKVRDLKEVASKKIPIKENKKVKNSSSASNSVEEGPKDEKSKKSSGSKKITKEITDEISSRKPQVTALRTTKGKDTTKTKVVSKKTVPKEIVPSKYFSPMKLLEIGESSVPITNFDSDDSSDAGDWEEVQDGPAGTEDELEDYRPQLPDEGVNIELEAPKVTFKREKKKKDKEAQRRLRINRAKKALQIDLHKCSFLGFMARGMYLNSLTKRSELQCLALSHFSMYIERDPVPKQITLGFLKKFLSWYRGYFTYFNQINEKLNDEKRLRKFLSTRVANSPTEFLLGFMIILRIIIIKDLKVRICYPIEPISTKVPDLLLSDKQKGMKKKGASDKKKSPDKNKTSPKTKPKGKNRKALSSESSSDFEVEVKSEPKKRKKGSDANVNYVEAWAEIYVSSEKKWISIEPLNNIFDEPLKIEPLINHNLAYVLAIDISNYVKDVTQRYASKFTHPNFRKLRLNDIWIDQTLGLFRPSYLTSEDIEEDRQLEISLSLKPIPATMSEFKDHPLYCLKKHLLKYQVIYPPDAPTVGFFKGEPIYPRDCVRITHTREYWMREARVVRQGETPYKISTARPKWDKYTMELLKDLPLELFGFWQTDQYQPPTARDGKVPRNEYGNVELFKACMLPIGTVHLQLPGLLRIANKLNIDCVSAVVGFDNHSGGSHPVFDGFVVCEEFKDTLLAAYDEEQIISLEREKKKREKRIYGNWRRLIRSVLIRERLRNKYGPESNSDTE